MADEVHESFHQNVHPWDNKRRSYTISSLQCSSNPEFGTVVLSDKHRIFAFTDYCGVAGIALDFNDGVFIDSRGREGQKGIAFAEISDGLSNTLMISERPPSEVDEGIGSWLGSQWICCSTMGVWETAETIGDNRILREVCDSPEYGYQMGVRGSRCCWTHHWSFHPGGANFSMADGSVHFIPYSISADTLNGLATRASGETVSLEF